MQIVIDIPEELYQSVLNGTYCGTLYEELKNGTPLPNRMEVREMSEWIPIKYHEATKEEIEENGYPFDICYIFDNVMPCDEQEILITVKGRSGKSYVEKDTCYADDGYYLDSGYDWLTDVVAWRELPQPYKAESEG